MISVSESWKEANKRRLLPESFIEISVGVTDADARELVDATSESEATFSNISSIVGEIGTPNAAKYATLEHNLWLLDGSRRIMPDGGEYATPGYVSANSSPCSIVLRLSEVRTVPIPGFTITWSSEYDEYPTAFTVEVKNGDVVVASLAVTDNTSSVVEIFMDVVDYDAVVVSVQSWNVPDHRIRMDRICFGHVMNFGKNDVLSYTHEQRGCLNSGELPKNSIEFSLNNSDGIWNPRNQTGLGKYLSERQTVSVRYGLTINGAVEWIKAGTFYLSEWRAPSNGLAAYFTARDVFEYMLNEPYTGVSAGTLRELVENALAISDLPDGFVVSIDSSLDEYTATLPDEKRTAAEVIQMCANAACCVVYQDRDGVLRIEPTNTNQSDYAITSDFSYAHPEVDLSKPLRAVSVTYESGQTHLSNFASTGETQTVTNLMVGTAEQAEKIANWVYDALKSRTTVTGDFRADPRLDVFDVVTVESKYGTIAPVAIINITYSYTGSFNATYMGRVVPDISNLGDFILGVSVLSEEE